MFTVQPKTTEFARDQLTKEELKVILDSTHDGMIAVNQRGIVTIFNAAAQRMTGLAADDLIGKVAAEVIPNTRLHIILQTGVSELNQQQDLGATSIITNRVPVRNSQGAVIGAVAVFRDIGEMKKLAEEITNLRQMQSLLEAIINSTQDAISVVDEQGIGLMINPAYTRLTGLTEKDVLNQPATVDIAEGESTHYQVLKTRQPVRGVRLKVGPAKKEVMVNVAPIIVDGVLKGSVGVIHDLSEIKKLTEELEQTKRLLRKLQAKYSFEDIIGDSDELLAAIEQAQKVAATSATILLRGESGTGKELFAHAIHNASPRKQFGFVRVNCASIPENLLESELFGYEDGAFTGASKGGKPGLFEQANGGTIFMDEIGEVSLHLQTSLLRVLQEREVRRIGGSKPISVDVRIIAATNANLEQKLQEGTFREDLYYRINVVPVFIPPLRRRKRDIDKLVKFFIKKFNREYGKKVRDIEAEALEMLKNYGWPGNVRELENIISRSIINMRVQEEIIQIAHLPGLSHETWSDNFSGDKLKVPVEGNLTTILSQVEEQVIHQVLIECAGNKTKAAQRLGLSIRNLYYKLEKYGLKA